MTQPRGMRGAALGSGGPHDSRGHRSPSRSRGPGQRRRWGALQGGLGVCIIVASGAVGAIVTIVARSAPGLGLGLFIVTGSVAAALAVRPKAGRMIFPVPILSYLVAALTSGVIVFDRAGGSSSTALAIAAAQWVASGFFAMALATVLAIVIIAARWYLWRRGRPAGRDSGWPGPPADPARTGPTRTGPTRAGAVQPGPAPAGAGRDGAPRPPRAGWETPTESRYPAGFAGPGSPRPGAAADGPRGWADPGTRGTGPRPSPRPGSEPYNFSSGA